MDNKTIQCQCAGNGECLCQDVSFLDPTKLKAVEDKILSGEMVCNVDSPEGCESCSG